MSNGKPKPTKDQGKSAPVPSSSAGGLRQRFCRSRKDGVLGGVCSGLAAQTDLAAWLWRLVFVGGTALFGIGALAYLFLWVFMGPDRVTPGPAAKAMFRKADWVSFSLTTLFVFVGYYLTLAPNLTLEDSGELATGSFYAGVPHPPGYPVWTIYTWLFTVLVPVSNVAWRVALSSAVAGAFACGVIALLTSRGSSMILEGIDALKGIERKWEDALCVVSGYVAGMLLGFNGFMWSQAVIVEVYTLSVLSLMGVLCCLLRWVYAPEQTRYLYWAFFLFGICFTNHQTLIVAAMGIEVAVLAARPKLGRDLFAANSIVYLVGLILRATGGLETFENVIMFLIFNLVGIGSLYIVYWFSVKAKLSHKLIAVATHFLFNVLIWFLWQAARMKEGAAVATVDKNFTLLLIFFNPGLITLAYLYHLLAGTAERVLTDWAPVVVLGLFWILGSLFYFYMPIASMTNPPLNWGYPRTVEGFIHALTRGQYEKTNPTSDPLRLIDQLRTYLEGAVAEFNMVYLLIGLVPVAYLFFRQANSAERKGWAWLTGVYGFLCMMILLAAAKHHALPSSLFGFSGVGVGIVCGYVFVILAALPFLFFRLMDRPERAWLGGLSTIYVGLAFLLLVLLNLSLDKQSREMNRVFFTASHVMIAMCIGYGLSIIGALVATHYDRFRFWGIGGTAVAASFALYATSVVFSDPVSLGDRPTLFELEPSQDPLVRFTTLFSLGLTITGIGIFTLFRGRAPMTLLLAVFAILPIKSVLSHWSDNEQRGHFFGYWFGHDMFTPPFVGPDGKLSYDARLRAEAMKGPNGSLVYPEMARDTILFGGTDPGRFCPTYMIFCESFISPEKKKDTDPKFDRRDVYIITQNALADGTYLSYIRAHYNRSAQIDPPFFQELFRSRKDAQRGTTNLAAQLVAPLDRFFTSLGERIEKRRRAEGVYPPREILTPTPEDHAQSMNEYMYDAQRRMQTGQLKPGEDVKMDPASGRLQVSGQVSVMAINGLLTKVIFDKNPTNEFYVEESFPLDWMYPYLEPYGIIMKINRQPLAEITDQMAKKDHEFWSKYAERLIGNWITYDTSVKEICDFIERVYRRRDYKGFKGDPAFIRDDQAQKSFSKLRSSVGGVYSYRYSYPRTPAERQRMMKEADFALRQAFAFCPYSPEAVFRYTTLLASSGRLDDAELVIEACLKFDRENVNVQNWLKTIRGYKQQPGQASLMPQSVGQLEQQYRTNPADAKAAFELASAYLQLGQTNSALIILDQLVTNPQSDVSALLSVANAYVTLQQGARLENVLKRLVQLSPNNPEAWYDLAGTQTLLGKTSNALQSLAKAIQFSDERLKLQPTNQNLRANAAANRNFDPIRQLPEFQKLIAQP
jgi:Flp pilus assembly protein TadD/phage shock protein PspC (stress-responsive transcriptional regulator)